MARQREANQLATFDPVTFYPALAATEKLKTRNASAVAVLPHKSITEPAIPKDFNPAVFYPALAAQEKAKVKGVVGGGRGVGDWRYDSGFEESLYPTDSISYSGPVVERPVLIRPPMDVELMQQRKRVRRRLWMIGGVVSVLTLIMVIVIAWCGSHNWFKADGGQG